MSVIFNEPGGGQTLSNPSQQNNVFQFVQTTKPTERSAGVALVAGDRWYKNDDGTSWFWNGTYWLNQTLLEISFKREFVNSPYGNYYEIIASRNSVFVETIVAAYLAAVNVSNFWTVSFSLQPVGAAGRSPLVTFVPQNTATYSADEGFVIKQAVPSNSPGSAVSQAGLCLYGNYVRTGSPAGMTISAALTYRHIFP